MLPHLVPHRLSAIPARQNVATALDMARVFHTEAGVGA